MTNCHGLLSFNTERVDVLHLTGQTSQGGTATITGTIGPLAEVPGLDLTIAAVDLPFDDALYLALADSFRPALDFFFDKPSYERLHEAGHFVTSVERQADAQRAEELAAKPGDGDQDGEAAPTETEELAELKRRLALPVFDLGGRANAVVTVRRDPGAGQPMRLVTTLDLTDAHVVFRPYPTPAVVRQGKLVIGHHDVAFDGVRAEGIRGGTVAIDGVVVRRTPDGAKVVRPEVKLRIDGIPVDDLLVDVLPEPQNRWLEDFHVSDGKISGTGRVFTNEQDEVDFELDLTVTEAQARPYGGQYVLDEVQGRLHVGQHKVRVEQMVGQYEQAVILLKGEVTWSDRVQPAGQLLARAQNMRLEDPVLDLIGPVERHDKLRRFWAERDPAGHFDASLVYRIGGPDEQRYTLDLQPRTLAFVHRGRRLSFDPVAGSMTLVPGRLELNDLQLEFPDGRTSVSGTIQLAEQLSAELTGRASVKRITDDVRHVLPSLVTRVIDTLKLDGVFDVQIDAMSWRPGATDGDEASFLGSIDLTDATCEVGVPVDGLHGKLTMDIKLPANAQWPRVQLQVDADRLRASNRQIHNLQAELRSGSDHEQLLVPTLRGLCYGGAIGGSGAVRLDDGRYEFALALNDVDLRQFLDAAAESQTDDEPTASGDSSRPTNAKQAEGVLAASLNIEGRWDQPGQRRGRGDVLIHKATLYELPLAMGLLQMTHLALPLSTSFHQARCSFYIVDDLITFEQLRLEAPTLILSGGGTMGYSDKSLDLSLRSTNPTSPPMGPLSELMSMVRAQLMTIRVTGTLDEPIIKVRQLSGIEQGVRDVFSSAESD